MIKENREKQTETHFLSLLPFLTSFLYFLCLLPFLHQNNEPAGFIMASAGTEAHNNDIYIILSYKNPPDAGNSSNTEEFRQDGQESDPQRPCSGAQNLAWILSSGSVSHILGSQAWNQPVKVGGSAPCLMVVMGRPLRPEGSESTYSLAA